jgi:hypothetical protein
MTNDPVVEEIHRVREGIAERFNNDLQAIADDARRRQADSGRAAIEPRARGATPRADKPKRAVG